MVKINHSIKKSQLFVRNITLHYISLTSVAIHPELWYIHIRSEMTLARQLPQPHVVEAPGSPQKEFLPESLPKVSSFKSRPVILRISRFAPHLNTPQTYA